MKVNYGHRQATRWGDGKGLTGGRLTRQKEASQKGQGRSHRLSNSAAVLHAARGPGLKTSLDLEMDQRLSYLFPVSDMANGRRYRKASRREVARVS